MVNHRKRYARKYLYHERSFGPEGREAMESDEDGRFVPVIDENRMKYSLDSLSKDYLKDKKYKYH